MDFSHIYIESLTATRKSISITHCSRVLNLISSLNIFRVQEGDQEALITGSNSSISFEVIMSQYSS